MIAYKKMDIIRWAFNFRNWSLKKEEWLLCFSVIQPEEKDRISKFVFQKDMKSSLAGRLMIRKLISEKFAIPWSSVILKRTERGRPYFEHNTANNLDFNVSHQGKWVVLAAENTGAKVGVDIMEIEKGNKNLSEFFRLMTRQFTTDEWNVIKKHSDEFCQLKAFYRNWCLKEAYVKALGIGISYDLQSISFIPHSELTVGNTVTDTEVKISGCIDPSWHFEESLIDEKHIAAIALHKTTTNASNNVQFKVLSYEDLILNAEQIINPDEELTEDTMLKSESPF